MTKFIHPAIFDWHTDWQHGRLSRREFLRQATLLGLSVTAAKLLTGCQESTEPTTNTTGPTAIKRGGILRVGTIVQEMIDHPARLTWLELANPLRHVAEYLTETGVDNLTRPLLLKKWEASEDVKTWTLHVRPGVKFNNGADLTATDVIFNFQQWLDPATESSMRHLLSYLSPNDIERVDDYTVRLHLITPQIGLPEHLFHFPGLILPHTFEGDFARQPIGTGPFLLAEHITEERLILWRREGYWKMGHDGQALPYLDELHYLHLERSQRVAALQGGEVDTVFFPNAEDWHTLQNVPQVKTYAVTTAQTLVLRMRVDKPPWDDVQVRQAMRLCQDRAKILQAAYFGEGELGIDAHVAPVHPAYCEKPIPDYQPERAKELLAEAGYPDGLTVTMTIKNDQGELEMARALQTLAAPAGFDIQINIVEAARYWEFWTDMPLGITLWVHRPLDTMVLALGYTADESGQPVAWNETRWVDEEFVTLLKQAEQTLNIDLRREIMCQLEEIMQTRGPIGISHWRKVWTICHESFKNVRAHPSGYDLFYDVWQDI